jgi:spore coat protein U-like protein
MNTRRALWALITVAGSVTTYDASATSVCTWTSITPCNFGAYNNTVHTYTTGLLHFNCTTHDTPVTLKIDASSIDTSTGCDGSACRSIQTAATPINYLIYKDAAHTQYFSNDATGQVVIGSPAVDNTVILYCDLFPGANPPAAATGYHAAEIAHLIFGASDLTSSVDIYTVVNGTCSVSVSTHLAFGAYEPVVTNRTMALDATATVSVTCTNYQPYTITLGQGSNAAGGSTENVPLRQMAFGTNKLRYDVYGDSGRNVVWGNTASTGIVGTGTGNAQSITVYGQVAAGQQQPAGSYVDTVLMTVTF